MIDTIYLNKTDYPEELLQDTLKGKWKPGFNKKKKRKCFYRNMTLGRYKAPITFKYSPKIRSLKLEFSLHKYLFGDNYKNYNLLYSPNDIDQPPMNDPLFS
jgi:hypothetical protein